MANRVYLELAKQAGDNEREYEWGMACELWLEAASKAPESSTDRYWALLRSDFCRSRGREHSMCFISETFDQREEKREALRGLSRLNYLKDN
ncbi:ANR family transcriptional regulator [Vibrio hyugaensis]|uniref:ANR family transcriptional regulator n=1 Tax=Vibrio hyugaensis TaxID=1534743 RepID=UPI0005EDDC16